MTATIRPCRADDAEALVNLVRELAVYENLEAFARATPDQIRAHFFGPRPFAEAILAEVDGEAVGFAIYFGTYSTFRGQPGMYLEDIFVRQEHRGKGIGRALLTTLARIAVDCGCGRVEWSVLDWNEPAIGFYRSLGALPLEEWTVYRIDDEALSRLAEQAPPLDGETPDA
jgi:GNAT superfamily N-acetyltransferase